MYHIVRRVLLGTVILLAMPAVVWASGWLWTPGMNPDILRPLFWVTETVSEPWGILTTIVLCAWFLWCLRFRLKAAVVLVVILCASIVIGQYVKDFIKAEVKEPRPYVAWLGTSHEMDVLEFYAMKGKERGKEVKALLGDDSDLPKWLKKSWQSDTGYAFPSGHTMFAATWALLALGILWPRRHFKTVAIMMAWAVIVMGSRLVLGMHWSRDLMASTAISAVLVIIACWLTERFIGPLKPPPAEQREIAEREADEAK